MPLQDTHPTPAFGGFGLTDRQKHLDRVQDGPPLSRPAPPSEVRPLSPPAIPSEVRPLSRPAPPSEVRPLSRPAPPSEVRPLSPPALPSEVRPLSRPAPPSEVRPLFRPAAPSEVRPLSRPALPSEVRPLSRPAPPSEVRPLSPPAIPSEVRPLFRPAAPSEVRPLFLSFRAERSGVEKSPRPQSTGRLTGRQNHLDAVLAGPPLSRPAPPSEVRPLSPPAIPSEVRPLSRPVPPSEVRPLFLSFRAERSGVEKSPRLQSTGRLTGGQNHLDAVLAGLVGGQTQSFAVSRPVISLIDAMKLPAP